MPYLSPRKPRLELGNVGLHHVRLQGLSEAVRVDSNGEGSHPRDAPAVFYPVRRALQAQNARAGTYKVAGIIIRVKPARNGGLAVLPGLHWRCFCP
jgi:hypothetical protein